MKKPLKKNLKNPLKGLSKKDLRYLLNSVVYQAVSSQYFGVSHKHRAHLWDIVNTVDPKLAECLDGSAEGGERAYDVAARRAGYYTEKA